MKKKIWLWASYNFFFRGGKKIFRTSRANSQKTEIISERDHKVYRAFARKFTKHWFFYTPSPPTHGKILYPRLYIISLLKGLFYSYLTNRMNLWSYSIHDLSGASSSIEWFNWMHLIRFRYIPIDTENMDCQQRVIKNDIITILDLTIDVCNNHNLPFLAYASLVSP